VRLAPHARRRVVALTVLAALTALPAVGTSDPIAGAASGAAAPRTCNGHAWLCERHLGDVAFATSHNSMSSAAEGFRGPNQGATIREQLRHGIRGFQIDAHTGVTRGSRVYTELTGSLASQKTDLPPHLVATALRIHRRLGAPPPGSPRATYLCHTFCEIGAMPMSEFARDVRRFLEHHPREVVMVVVEDHLAPDAIRQVLDDAGLTPMLLATAPGAPLPTLGEMLDAGKQLFVTLESGDGGPTLPNAFETLVEETPFTFLRAGDLRGRASCAPNRGPEAAPIFQLNHWVTPAGQRRSRLVNRARLRARVRECTHVRGRAPTLVAVDFAEDSDVVDVVEALNHP